MKYEINGKVVETDHPLSESEIDEIGQQIGGTASPAAQPATPQQAPSLSFGQALSTFGGPGGIAETPWSKFNRLYKDAVGSGAEAFSQAHPSVSPNIVAGAALPVSMFPESLALASIAGSGTAAAENAAGRVSDVINSGARIGAVEKAAGVVTKAAEKYPTSGNVGEYLNNLEAQLDAGTLSDPQQLQQANSITRFIFQNPNIVGKEKAVLVQASRVAQKVNRAFNEAVPGRGPAAQDFATLMKYVDAAKTAGKVLGATAGAGALGSILRYLRTPLGH